MIKIDLMRAYDSVEWPFFETMLRELGFPIIFIKWGMKYITTISYFMLVNGAPPSPFKACTGIRWGDPISPYLFTIAIEYLSRCLSTLSVSPFYWWSPHLFIGERVYEHVLRGFRLYANYEKIATYTSGLSHEDATQISEIVEMPLLVFPFRYLGILLSYKILSVSQCIP